MALFDKPLDELRSYKPAREEQADFDDFWAGTLTASRQHDLQARFAPVESGLRRSTCLMSLSTAMAASRSRAG